MLRIIFRPLLNMITRLSRFIKVNIINRKKKVSIIDFIFILHKEFRNSYLYKIIIFLYTIAIAIGAIITLSTMYNEGFDLDNLEGKFGSIKNNFVRIYRILIPNSDKSDESGEEEDIGNPFPYDGRFDLGKGRKYNTWTNEIENEYHWYKDPYIIGGGLLLILLLSFFGLTNSLADEGSGSIMSLGRIKSGISNIFKHFKLYFNSIYESSQEAAGLRGRTNLMDNIEQSIESFKLKDLDPLLFGDRDYYSKIKNLMELKENKILPEFGSDIHKEMVKSFSLKLEDFSKKLDKEYFDKLTNKIKTLNSESLTSDPFKARIRSLAKNYNGEEVIDLSDAERFFTTPKANSISLTDNRDINLTPKPSTSKLPDLSNSKETITDLKTRAQDSVESAIEISNPNKPIRPIINNPDDTPKTAAARLDAQTRIEETGDSKPSLASLFGGEHKIKLRKTVTNDRSDVKLDTKGKSKAIEDAKTELNKVKTDDRSHPILKTEPIQDNSLIGALQARRDQLGMNEDNDTSPPPAGKDWDSDNFSGLTKSNLDFEKRSQEIINRYKNLGDWKRPHSPTFSDNSDYSIDLNNNNPKWSNSKIFNKNPEDEILKSKLVIPNPQSPKDEIHNQFMESFLSRMGSRAPSINPSPLVTEPKLPTFEDTTPLPKNILSKDNKDLITDYNKVNFDDWLSKQDKHMRLHNEEIYFNQYSQFGIEFKGSHNEAQAKIRELKLREMLNTPQNNSPIEASELQTSVYAATFEQPFNPHLALIEKLNDRAKVTEDALLDSKDLTEGSILFNPETRSYVMFTEGKFELVKFNTLDNLTDLSEISPDKTFEQLNIVGPDKIIKLDRSEMRTRCCC